MVEKLSEENRSLRQELKDYYKKVSKLEKVNRLNGKESIDDKFNDLKVFFVVEKFRFVKRECIYRHHCAQRKPAGIKFVI